MMKKSINAIKKYYLECEEKFNKPGKDNYTQFVELNTENSEFRNESNLYESNIHPLLRFIHNRDIKPSGWINIKYDEKHIVKDDKKMFNCEKKLTCISSSSYCF